MPCHSPMKTREMVSLTRALPSEFTVIVSWKFEMCQDLAESGAARARMRRREFRTARLKPRRFKYWPI